MILTIKILYFGINDTTKMGSYSIIDQRRRTLNSVKTTQNNIICCQYGKPVISLMLLDAPNVKGNWIDSNFHIIDLIVQPRAAEVAGTLIFVHIVNFATTLAACRIFYLLYFISQNIHKGHVLLCDPSRHRAICD